MKPKIIPQEQSIQKFFLWGVALLTIGFVATAGFWYKLPPLVPLFYNRTWGDQQLASPIFLTIPLGISLLFLLINSLLAQVFTTNSFLKKVFGIGAVTVSVLATVTVIRIVLLVV